VTSDGPDRGYGPFEILNRRFLSLQSSAEVCRSAVDTTEYFLSSSDTGGGRGSSRWESLEDPLLLRVTSFRLRP
jgi:hypothetical protein